MKYLDDQEFHKLDRGDKIYFMDPKNDKWAKLAIDVDDKYCEVNFQLVEELKSFFGLNREESLSYIQSWVNDNIDSLVDYTWSPDGYHRSALYIPED